MQHDATYGKHQNIMEYNEIPAKQSENKWSEKMNSSYCQIEKQLLKSSKP